MRTSLAILVAFGLWLGSQAKLAAQTPQPPTPCKPYPTCLSGPETPQPPPGRLPGGMNPKANVPFDKDMKFMQNELILKERETLRSPAPAGVQ